MNPALEDNERCSVMVDLGQRCDKPLTETVYEPYTPASFPVEYCDDWARDLIDLGYRRAK